MTEEMFTDDEIVHAIEQFLEYAEREYGKSQQGYFSGKGWSARCLTFAKNKLLNQMNLSKQNNNFVRIE